MGREFELKYRTDPSTIPVIQEKYGPFSAITMKTVYYDTPSRILRPRRWTLRKRMENGVPVCTLKTPGADGSRGEWEVSCQTIEAAIPMLLALGAPAELTELTAEGLEPTCGVRFTRLAANVSFGESVLELALDRGEFLGGDRTAPFAEVEVELKQGRDQDAMAFGGELARLYGLQEEPDSKLKRALELAAAAERDVG